MSFQKASRAEVTAVLFKTTSQKEFHPRLAVVLFSRVCSTRTPGRISRCYQEKVCQTLENKTTSTEYHRCRLEKNGRDPRAVPFLRSGSPGLVISRSYGWGTPCPPRLAFCGVIAHKQVRRLKENTMAHIAQNIWISLTSLLINPDEPII